MTMKTPLLDPQHIKAMATDHGLNRDPDAIVICLQTASKTASGRIPSRGAACSAGGVSQNARLHWSTGLG
jgi:hypothetical protein